MSYPKPALAYSFNTLEPVVTAKNLEIHSTKHHVGYWTKTVGALEGTAAYGKPILEILRDLSVLPEEKRLFVRNNGGGYYNHTFYFEALCAPNTSSMPARLKARIEEAFGTVEAFTEKFVAAANGVFGSGWAWLVENNGKLEIATSPNQDLPEGKLLLNIDVWEHAYYPTVYNDRPAYTKGFMSIIDWSKVDSRLD